jgi:hypothetical protein
MFGCLTIRIICNSRFYHMSATSSAQVCGAAHLESLVLKHSFDGSILSRGREFGLEDHSKRAISNDLALCILHISSLSCNAILDLFANHLYLVKVLADKRISRCGVLLTSHSQTGERCRAVLRHLEVQNRLLP